MKIAIRYCSTYGRTKAIAEEMAAELGVEAVSVRDEPELSEPVDVLFLGGAPYWNIMDPALQAYAERLRPEMVGAVVLFTTSNWSHRTAIGLREILESRGIAVAPGHFYSHMSQIDGKRPAARTFAQQAIGRLENPTAVPSAPNTAEIRTELVTVGAFAALVIATIALIAHAVKK